jgi:hypothetical protein
MNKAVIPGRAPLRANPESRGNKHFWIPGSPAKSVGAPE